MSFEILPNTYDLDEAIKNYVNKVAVDAYGTTRKFKEYINETGFDIIGRIPFDFSIAEAMSFAQPVVEYDPTSKASISINEIYLKLKKSLWN